MKFLRFFNAILIILQALFFIGISAQLFFVQSSFSELSANLYGKDAPLMNSYLIEYIGNKFVAMIFFIVSYYGLYKVIKVVGLKQKILLNAVLNLVHISIGMVLIMILYS